MRRTLSWLVAGAIVAGLGGASMASSTDSFIPVQDPPELTIGNLNQHFGVGSTGESVDRILPSASEATIRDGFTGGDNAANEITTGLSYDYDLTDTEETTRVAPNATVDSAPYYRQQVTVSTNGPTNTIKRVGYCLINIEDDAVISDGTFRWYDASSDAETNDLERNCGFNDENPMTDGLPDSARAVVSIIYDVDAESFTMQGTNQHVVMKDESNTSDATWNENTLTVNFAFKPSHALMKQSSGWIVRAAAQDQPEPLAEGEGAPGDDEFEPQMAQIFWGDSTTYIQDQLNNDNSNDASRDSWRFASVGYYGAIMSDRDSVSYGTLRKGDTSLVTGITTGRYIANAESRIWIHATDFKIEGDGGTPLDYVADGDPLIEGSVKFLCSYDTGDASIGDSPEHVTNDAVEIKSDLPLTTDESTPEDAVDINATGMSCSLQYGGGAEDAASAYVNEVTLSIQDAGTRINPTP